ncbi:MAG: DUF664 domain-containing protein [Nocardioidaceae bacterium]
MTETVTSQDPWWHPPVAGTEDEHLVGALERQRTTFRWKVAGLDSAGLALALGASTMTLGGLLKHLAFVEDFYFTARLHQTSPGKPWEDVDWDAEPDWDWSSAASDSPAQLYALHDAAVARSRAHLAAAIAHGGLDQVIDLGWPDGRKPSLRRMLCDLIEEFGRHTGHADLLREAVDGRTGEDPPRDFDF